MDAKHWTQNHIAKVTGVHQSQVSRICSGKFKRLSANVNRVCKYANITVKVSVKKRLPETVRQALQDLLDGTADKERAVLAVLKACSTLSQQR